MDFAPSPRAADLTERVRSFMATEIDPVEPQYHRDLAALRERSGDPWTPSPLIAELQAKAREQRAVEPVHARGARGSTPNASAPTAARAHQPRVRPVRRADGPLRARPPRLQLQRPGHRQHGGAAKYGTDAQKTQWLEPLLEAEIRSAFCMTEPDVASSDATNMAATAVVDGDEVVVNGRKWWSTGIGHPDCELLVFMGLTDPDADRHTRHSMVLVPRRRAGRQGRADAVGDGHVRRALRPWRGLVHRRPRAAVDHVLVGPGRPSRSRRAGSDRGASTTACGWSGWRSVPSSCASSDGTSRTAFGEPLVNLGGNRERIADARIAIDQLRLLVLHTAWLLDTVGPAGRAARSARSRSRHRASRRTSSTWRSSCTEAAGSPRRPPAGRGLGHGPLAAARRRTRRGAPRR